MKQERRFELFMNGEIKYYKNKDHKGTLILIKGSKARKVGRSEATLRIPGTKKDYVFLSKDPTKCPPTTMFFSCVLDDWVDAINSVCRLQPE